MKAWVTLPFATALLLAAGMPAQAASARHPTHVKAGNAWIRVLPAGLPASGYVTLTNSGKTADAVTSASSPDYQRVSLHRSTMHNGMSSMHMVKQIKLPAHATVKLAPGGYHLMLMHATQPVKAGDHVPVTLHFADGGSLTVDFEARPANAH